MSIFLKTVRSAYMSSQRMWSRQPAAHSLLAPPSVEDCVPLIGSFPLLVMVYIGSSVGSPYRRRWGGRARLFRARLLRWHDGGLVASTAMAAHPRAPISTLCGVSDRMPCPASGGARGYAAAAGGGDGTRCSDAWACAPRGVRRKRWRRRSRCARPNIWRFSIFRRLM